MLSGPLVKIGGYAITVAVNFGLYMLAFRFLTSATVPTRCLWLGAGVGALFLTVMQLVWSIYVKHVISHASNTYGTFATVIGLLVWLHLIAQLTLYAAELNVVVMRRLLRKGLPLSCCIAYMLAGPIINVVVMFSTWVAFRDHKIGYEMVGLRVGLEEDGGLLCGSHAGNVLYPFGCVKENGEICAVVVRY